MKYVVGVISFVFVFVVVYIMATLALVMWSPAFMENHFPSVVQGVNNPIGIVFALAAGISSFRASIKKKEKNKSHNNGVERTHQAFADSAAHAER